MTEKVRAYAPPMLWDGLPQAIRNIRTRKDLSQAEAAERGGTTADKWSQWETRTKRLLRKHLPIVTKGLKVTEGELQREAARLQDQHYVRQAAEIGEPRPIYDTSITSSVIGGLPQGGSDLPAPAADLLNKLSNASAVVVGAAMTMADCVKDGAPALSQAFRSMTAGDGEDDSASEDPGEEPTDR